MENGKTVAEVIVRMVTGRSCLPVLISRVIDRRCESEEDCRNIECRECQEKWLGILADMIEQEKAEAVSVAMERTMVEQMREWAAENGLPAFREDEGFAQWLDRCFLPRPLFEDGEPVQFGDDTDKLHGVEKYIFVRSCGGGCQMQDADGNMLNVFPGDFVKRHAPKVLDADGVPIEVGDTVWFANGGIDDDATMPPYEYCAVRGIDLGDDPDREAATTAMVRDLLRRQRELDARKGGAE